AVIVLVAAGVVSAAAFSEDARVAAVLVHDRAPQAAVGPAARATRAGCRAGGSTCSGRSCRVGPTCPAAIRGAARSTGARGHRSAGLADARAAIGRIITAARGPHDYER